MCRGGFGKGFLGIPNPHPGFLSTAIEDLDDFSHLGIFFRIFRPRDFSGMGISRGWEFFSWDGISHQKATSDFMWIYEKRKKLFLFENETYILSLAFSTNLLA